MKWAGLSQVKLSFHLQTDSSEPIIKQSASGDDFQQELSCLSLVRILDDNDCKMHGWSMILDNEIFSLLMTQVAASNIVQHLLWMQATAHNFLFSLTDTAAGGSSCPERQNSKFMRLTSHTHYTQITAENKTLTQHICMLTWNIYFSFLQDKTHNGFCSPKTKFRDDKHSHSSWMLFV